MAERNLAVKASLGAEDTSEDEDTSEFLFAKPAPSAKASASNQARAGASVAADGPAGSAASPDQLQASAPRPCQQHSPKPYPTRWLGPATMPADASF